MEDLLIIIIWKLENTTVFVSRKPPLPTIRVVSWGRFNEREKNHITW